jgi:hypothetical protein
VKNSATEKILDFTNNNLSKSQVSYRIKKSILLSLNSIDQKITEGRIRPGAIKPHRVGILAFSANPLHWGHITSSLVAIDELNLDVLFYLVQGEMTYKKIDDSQKLPKELRHRIARKVCEGLSPLVRYSPVGLNNDQIGEYNSLKILTEYPGADIYYFTGSESQERIDGILENLVVAQREYGIDNKIKLAIMPIGKFKNITSLKNNKVHYPIEVIGCDYDCELHSTQYRQGDTSIIPRLVLDILS